MFSEPHGTDIPDFTLIESKDVFVNFNASLCGQTGYIYKVRHILSANIENLDYTILQITNGHDAMPKGLKLAKRSINLAQTKMLHGIGYGDPKKTSEKVLDYCCPIILSIETRINDCEKWLHESVLSVDDDPEQFISLNPPNGQNKTIKREQNRLQIYRKALQKEGSDVDTVNKAYKDIPLEQNIFLDICMQHRGSGSPFLTNEGFVAGILTNGHPDFFFLLPEDKQAGFPSDKRFERLLRLDYVYEMF